MGCPRIDSRERTQGFGLQKDVQFKIVEEMSSTILNMRLTGKQSMLPFQKGSLCNCF